jgi:ABC-2 type transport system ATP-binding protein
MNAIEVQHLKRIYRAQIGVFRRSIKEVVAVEDVSFEVGAGELFGLLGPNGAGKTTTVKMLTTLLIPTAGTASVMGHDVVKDAKAVQKRIGFIFGGERGLYWRLSGIDNLRYFGSLYHVDPEVAKTRIPELLELVGLRDRGNERVEGYSRGMKQRLHVARTLLHDPEVLFLDEPTIGLDPVGARDFRQVIRNLQTQTRPSC